MSTPPLHPLGLFRPLSLPQTPPALTALPVPPASPQSPVRYPQLVLRTVSPPTPAPSPHPYDHERFPEPDDPEWSPTQTREQDDEARLQRIRRQFGHMSANSRLRLLEALIADSSPTVLSPLLPLIIPKLKRDFLKTLPVELAFHVLCFVDDVRTLARAAGVSRFWRALLEDEGTWKRMCWKSGFGAEHEEGGVTAGERIRSLEFGEREEEIGTPAGRERRGTLDRESLAEFAARAEFFGLRPVDEERGETGTWFVPPAHATNVWGPETTGLGFAGGLPHVGAVDDDTISERRARLLASRNARGVGDLPLPSTPQQPVPFRNHASGSDRDDLSPRHYRTNSLSPTDPTTPTLNAPLLPAYRSPLAAYKLPSTLPPDSAAPRSSSKKPFSYKTHFKRAYLTESNWLRGPGRLLSTQMSTDDGVVTSLGFDNDYVAVGMATSKVHIFDAATGAFNKTLEGHELGVWCLVLVSKGGGPREDVKGKGRETWDENEEPIKPFKDLHINTNPTRRPTSGSGTNRLFTNDSPTARSPFFRHPRPSAENQDPPPPLATPPPPRRRRRSFHGTPTFTTPGEGLRTGGMGLGAGGETGDSSQQAGVCGTARGWGRQGAVVVSGGCDRDVRVWDVETGACLHVLRGHTSTVRCLRVIDGRPIAVSGSRDATLRVWDIEKGVQINLLAGHDNSVRCIEVSGNKVVSGSYDTTCRLWDVDTGECLFVYRGHFHQIYAVAFDGIRVVTGSLDSTVRIWSATTGEFIALLQGHTSLVGQLQLDPVSNVLVTGGSDGRVIVFSLSTFECLHRLCAHDNSVTCLQFDDRFIVTGGNDGRIKLWDFKTGAYIRELAEGCEAVWRVTFRDDKCVILFRRQGKTIFEVRTFRPTEIELHGEE